MGTFTNEKHKQHYVWRYYLESWSDEQLVWCLRDGKIFQPNIRDVAQKRNFYKVQALDSEELGLLNAFIEKFPPHLRTAHNQVVELFTLAHKHKRAIDRQIESSKTPSHPETDALRRSLDIINNNLEEEIHATIEGDSQRFITAIRAEDVSFWSSSEKLDFIQYVCLQMLRTKKIQDTLNSLIEEKMPENLNLQKIWGVMRHLLTMNVAHAIYSDKAYDLMLILNDSPLPFITSDQPVINTFSFGLTKYDSPKDLEIYYPLSPRKAIMITTKGNGTQFVTEAEVRKYNDYVFHSAHEQIYSSSRSLLEEHVKSQQLQ